VEHPACDRSYRLRSSRARVVNDRGELTHPKLLYAKGILFLLAGVLSAAALLAEAPTVRVALLLALTVWCFARAYYFAFYVIQHYIDARFRFSGLLSVVRHMLWKRPAAPSEAPPYPCDPRSL
jgi:hypothetical protein